MGTRWNASLPNSIPVLAAKYIYCGSCLFIFCGYRSLGLASECGDQSVPSENCALNTGREFVDPGEDREFADIAFATAGRGQLMGLFENLLHNCLGFAFHDVCEKRGGRFGNAPASPGEADVFDDFAIRCEDDAPLVTAGRVGPLSRP